jgi:hypothetical protein
LNHERTEGKNGKQEIGKIKKEEFAKQENYPNLFSGMWERY